MFLTGARLTEFSPDSRGTILQKRNKEVAMKHILQNGVLILFMLLCPVLSMAQVCPDDFEGRYSLVWNEGNGILSIEKQKSVRNVTCFNGCYTTEDKQTYTVKGKVNLNRPNEIIFTIGFSQSQEFKGYLMAKPIDAITGYTLAKKTAGFLATRIAPIATPAKTSSNDGSPITSIEIIKAIGRASSPGRLILSWEYGSGERPISLEIDVCSEGKSIILGGKPLTISGSMTSAEINVNQVFYIPHEIICFLHYPSGIVPEDKIFVANCRIGEKTVCLPAKQPASIVKIDIPKITDNETVSFTKMILKWGYGEGEKPVSLTIDVQRDGGTVLPMGELITVNGTETQKEISVWRILDIPHDIIFYAHYLYGTIPREKIYTFKQRIVSRSKK